MPRSVGRPKLRADARKSITIGVRVTRGLYLLLKDAATADPERPLTLSAEAARRLTRSFAHLSSQ